MHLKSLSDTKLLADTKMHAKQEKLSGIAVLHHLREIDARKLFAKEHESLYGYCRKELEMSEGTAGRRIQAMKLIRDLPEYENKLSSATVYESTLCTVQTFFNREKKKRKKIYSKEAKLDLLKDLDGKSVREVDFLLASISPVSARKESKKAINAEEVEITLTIPKSLEEKLSKLKNLLGRKLPDQQYVTLLEELANLALTKLEPKPPTLAVAKSETRYIPANVKRKVRERDQGRCTYKNPKGERCASQYALQYEHIIPFGKGGQTTVENLTLFCLAHNQLSAIQAYGLGKMASFLKPVT